MSGYILNISAVSYASCCKIYAIFFCLLTSWDDSVNECELYLCRCWYPVYIRSEESLSYVAIYLKFNQKIIFCFTWADLHLLQVRFDTSSSRCLPISVRSWWSLLGNLATSFLNLKELDKSPLCAPFWDVHMFVV